MIITQHNDNARTGANLEETVLTPSSILPNSNGPPNFGKVAECLVDGSIYAQPLLVPAQPASLFRSPVLVVATMHNTLYAFNATDTGIAGWTNAWSPINLAPSVQLPAPDVGYEGYDDIIWELGIVSTPVIDTTADTLYCVTYTRDSEDGGQVVSYLWVIKLSTGTVLARSAPIEPPNFGSSSIFKKNFQLQRAALTLSSGNVYVTYASFGDTDPYTGWIVSFPVYQSSDAGVLRISRSWASTTDQGRGGIWQAGQGPAVDTNGSLYFMTGNGVVDPHYTPGQGHFGDSVVKLSAALGETPLSWFTPHNYKSLNDNDTDLGSSGILIIQNPPAPTSGPLCLGGGKQSILYLMNGNSLGGYSSAADNVIYPFPVAKTDGSHQILGAPVLYGPPSGTQYIYIWAQGDVPKRYQLNSDSIPISLDGSNMTVTGLPRGQGGFLSISGNGDASSAAVLWGNHTYSGQLGSNGSEWKVRGVLYAFEALSPISNALPVLWNSQTNPRDDYGNYNKFAYPTVGNGRAYQGTMGGIQQNQKLDDQCSGSPAMININDSQLVIAFASTSNPSVLCLRSSTDGLTWPDSTRYVIPHQETAKSPGLAYDSVNNTAYIAWIATDGTNRICMMRSVNDPTLKNWHGPTPSPEKSEHGVALAFGAGNLFVGWTGTDSHLNVGITTDLLNIKKYTFPADTSDAKPYLFFQPGSDNTPDTLYIAWRGKGNGYLNINSTTAAQNWTFSTSRKVEVTRETSGAPPAINFDIYNKLWISWTGTNNNEINQIVSDNTSSPAEGLAAWPNYKRIFSDTSSAGPALCTYQGRTHIAWEATDDIQSLCVAILNRGSVVAYGLLEQLR